MRGHLHTLVQLSSLRYMDAHQSGANDYSVVTRPAQNNNTQQWQLTMVAGVYMIQQLSTDQFIDAHEHAGADYSVVTRPSQYNDTQRWVVSGLGRNLFTIDRKSVV